MRDSTIFENGSHVIPSERVEGSPEETECVTRHSKLCRIRAINEKLEAGLSPPQQYRATASTPKEATTFSSSFEEENSTTAESSPRHRSSAPPECINVKAGARPAAVQGTTSDHRSVSPDSKPSAKRPLRNCRALISANGGPPGSGWLIHTVTSSRELTPP